MQKVYRHRSPIEPGWENEIIFSTRKDLINKHTLLKSGFHDWSNQTYSSRSSLFLRLIELLQVNRFQINQLIRLETGKTIQNCEGEFDSALSLLRLITSYEHFPEGKVLPSRRADRFAFQVRAPLGISLLIFPSNAPLPNFIWKLAPALMAGNVVLAKPSPYTAKTFDFLLNLMRAAGFDEDVLQKVDGEVDELLELLNLGLDLVSFTGSTSAGSIVAKLAAPHLTKIILECGGINPFIVDETVEIDQVIPVFCESAFGNSGQRCAAASVLMIHDSIRNRFLEKVQTYMEMKTTGIDDDASFGPLCSNRYVESLQSYLESLIRPKLSRYTKTLNVNEFIFQPTILDTEDQAHDLFESEIYGPICKLYRFRDIQEAISLANGSKFGLTSAVWSNNQKTLDFARRNIRYGVLNLNGPTFGSEPNFPFGGFRMSGNGLKEAGYNCIDEYSTSTVVSQFSV
jgi:acyl-CoA reductase-like NAD-dependent aldehyde dehydrogenase